MAMIEVTMYRIVCDGEDCKKSPQEDEYYAWLEPGTAIMEAENDDWYVSQDGKTHYCHTHQPQCPNEDCGAFLRDDEFGKFCEEHAEEPDAAATAG